MGTGLGMWHNIFFRYELNEPRCNISPFEEKIMENSKRTMSLRRTIDSIYLLWLVIVLRTFANFQTVYPVMKFNIMIIDNGSMNESVVS